MRRPNHQIQNKENWQILTDCSSYVGTGSCKYGREVRFERVHDVPKDFSFSFTPYSAAIDIAIRHGLAPKCVLGG